MAKIHIKHQQKKKNDHLSQSKKDSSKSDHSTHSTTIEMEKFSIDTTTSPQNNNSSVHNSPVNVDSTIKNESQITFLENTSAIMNIKPQTSSMKELSSSNHPTHSSTNIETQISPVNLSQSKKDSSKSDHSTHSPTKNESGVSLKDANPLSKETTNKLSTKRSSLHRDKNTSQGSTDKRNKNSTQNRVDKNHTEDLMQSKTNIEADESLNSTKLPPNHTPNPQQPKIDAPNKSKKKTRINTSY